MPSTKVSTRCSFCGGQSKVIQNKIRYDEKRNVRQCQKCSLVFLEAKDFDAKEYYKKEYRKQHSPVIGKALKAKDIFDINLPFQAARVAEIKPMLTKKTRLLEIGCSTGHFLATVKPLVKEVVGIEFNEEHVKFVRSTLGVSVYDRPIQETDLQPNSFDVICLYQVFEHIERPLEFLQSLQPYLKKGGHIIVEVPNLQDPLLSFYSVPTYKPFYYHNAHCFYYSDKTLLNVLKAGGFTGRVQGYQLYNLLNHLHWLYTGQPQKSAATGIGDPVLATGTAHPKAEKELNRWVARVNGEYKQILRKHLISDCLLFIGKKKG